MNQNFSPDDDLFCPLFYRTKSFLAIDTLFLIGNGSIENGNFPLSEALKVAQKEDFFPFHSDKIEEAALSYASLNEQDMFDLLILLLKKANPPLPEYENLSSFQACVGRLFSYAIGFRKILAHMYKIHSSSLKIRKDIWELLKQEGIEKQSSVCVTSNWDEVFWDHPAIPTVLHIHGRSSHPSSLILPTERVSQRYIKSILIDESFVTLRQLAKKENVAEHVDQIIAHYTLRIPNSVGAQMARAKYLMTDWLNSAKKIVISGIRFNEYDHELIATVSTFKGKNLKEIVLINKAESLDKMKAKIDRVSGLFSCSPSIIKFLNTSEKVQKPPLSSPQDAHVLR